MGRKVAGYELPDTLNELTALQARASDMKRLLEKRLARIREDRSTTSDGKRTLIAREWLEFKPTFDGLRQQDSDGFAAAKRAQRLKLVGLKERSDPAAIVAFRDAMQRAEALPAGGLTPAERAAQQAAVQSLLNTADLAGDDVLARAVLCVALDRHLTEVVKQYEDQYPHEANEIADYRSLLDHDPTVTMNSYYLWQVRTPQEIAAPDVIRGSTIEELAAQPVALSGDTVALLRRQDAARSTVAPDWMTSRGQAAAQAQMQDAPSMEF